MSPGFRFFQFPWRSRALIAREVDAELAFHLEARTAELVAQGLDAEAARRQALEEFGDLEFTRQYCRRLDERTERKVQWKDRLGDWWHDLRYAGRALRKSPGFAAVSILTLALAIGANAAIFSVARAVLLAPLPYGDPAALVALNQVLEKDTGDRFWLSPPNLADYRARQRSLTDIGAYLDRLTTWQPPSGDPEILDAVSITANLFGVLRVGAYRGRGFAAGDDGPGARATAVLSYGFWRRAFGGDPGIVGRTITLDGQSYDVIGVMPRGFTVTGDEDLWLPLDLSDDLARAQVTRKQSYLRTIARLKPDVTLAAARADVLGIARQLQREYPEANAKYLATLVPLRETMAADLERPLLLLFGAAALVLVIACANLANVTLSRAVGRRAELAVRAALGAGRARLARQLFTESILLALIGGVVGVGLAAAGTRLLLALNPSTLPTLFHVTIDRWVLTFSLGLSAMTGVLFGLAPVLGATRADLHGSLKESGRGGTLGRWGERMRRGLVVAQVALAALLLVGAGLLARSFRELTHVQLGFDPDHVLTARFTVDGSQYDSSAAVNRLYDDVIAEIARAPGVAAAGAISHLPTRGRVFSTLFVDGEAPTERPPDIAVAAVRGDYFAALRIPLVAGRLFDATDAPNGPKMVLINEAAARAFFPTGAVGRRIHIGPDPTAPGMTIVGVVGDTRDAGLNLSPGPAIFLNGRQEAWWRTLSLVVRTTGEPGSAVPVVRRAVKAADPMLALRQFEELDHVIGSSLAPRRFGLALATCLAGLALVLAVVGIYGVLAYSVTSRTREFGVRLALGAPTRSVLFLVLREGLGWTLVGLGLGVGGALAGRRLLAGMLYGIGPADGSTYLAVVLGLPIVAAVACLVPAVRATSVDPLASTRAE